MASSPTSFKQRLIPILSTYFGITDPATLDAAASALSEAIHDYITQDVQVAAGQPVTTSTGAGATSGPGKLF